MINTNKMPYIAVEINEILRYMSDDILSKIPNDVKIYFSNIASRDYIFRYDENKSLEEQRIQKETKEMLAIIYKDYVCNEQEKKEFIQNRRKIDYEIEEEKRKKYDVNNIFKKEYKTEEVKKKDELIVVDKRTNLFNKLISLIKRMTNWGHK